MSTIDGLWHVLNFVAPMVAVGVLVALSARTFFRRAIRSTSLPRLAFVASAGACIGYAGAVAWMGRDGAIAAYAVMLTSTALVVGWVSMRSRPD